jgi:transcriptional regulator with XRE-family HTH domain
MSEAQECYRALQKALEDVRRRKRLTQAEVAERLGKPQSFVSKYEGGERTLDVIEFLEVCKALDADPHSVLDAVGTRDTPETIFDRWEITAAQVTALVDSNPSLRGIILGYVAEEKAHEVISAYPGIEDLGKDDDHNRRKKGDRRIRYKGKTFIVEVKSLQTHTVKELGQDQWSGAAQCDASDRRAVKFKDGSELETTLLLFGEFDVLAVGCFGFGNRWRFAYAKNADLPASNYSKYTAAQREALIASMVRVFWPPKPPFTEDLPSLLDELLTEEPKVEIEAKEETVTKDEIVLEVKPKAT